MGDIMSDIMTHKDIYTQLKFIFEGCDTIIDALQFGNLYIAKYPHMKSMILSYMNGRTYRDTVDIKSKQCMLNDVLMCKSRNEALSIKSKIIDKTTDDVYRKTLERIAHTKIYADVEYTHVVTQHKITKKCPHCSHAINMPNTTQYVICGYQNISFGYDWNGCGRDWCFQCNKILCKRWEVDNLHLILNRQHDNDCCSKHAFDNNNIYPDNYCQCYNTSIINFLFI